MAEVNFQLCLHYTAWVRGNGSCVPSLINPAGRAPPVWVTRGPGWPLSTSALRPCSDCPPALRALAPVAGCYGQRTQLPLLTHHLRRGAPEPCPVHAVTLSKFRSQSPSGPAGCTKQGQDGTSFVHIGVLPPALLVVPFPPPNTSPYTWGLPNPDTITTNNSHSYWPRGQTRPGTKPRL